MSAYYYTGAYYRDRGDSPQAVEWYRKAFEAADTTLPDFNGDIYNSAASQIAYICSDSENYREELEWQKKRKIRYSESRYIDYSDLATSYYMVGRLDSAVYYSDKSFDEIRRLPRQTVQSKYCINDLMAFFLEQNATSHIRKLSPLFMQSYTEDPFGVTDMNFGCYHEYCGNSDSAVHYWKKSTRGSKFVTVREAYKYLFREYRRRGEKDSALHYCERYMESTDSLSRQNAGERVLKMNRLYNYQDKLRENSVLREKNLRARIWIWTSLFFLSVALWGIWIGRRFYRRRILKAAARQEKSLRALRTLRARREEELGALRGELERVQSRYHITSSRLRRIEEKHREEFKVCRKEINDLLSMAEAKEMLDADGWTRVDDLVERVCPGFAGWLTVVDSQVTQMEGHICKLAAVLGIKGTAAAALMGTSRQNVSRIYLRLCRRLSGGKGGNDLREVLKELSRPYGDDR